MAKDKIVYIVYDWGNDEIKKASYDRKEALATVGFDYLQGECVDDYKFLEVNLDELEDY